MIPIKYLLLVLGQVSLFHCVDFNKKLERIESNIDCLSDNDCAANQFCYGNDRNRQGKCKCMDNFVSTKNYTHYDCLPIADNIGFKCKEDIQCHYKLSTNAMCDLKNTGFCQCKLDSHFIEHKRMCFLTVALGGLCKVHENCKLIGNQQAYCVSGKCACNDNEHPSADGTRCVHTSRLGDKCISSDSCVSMNSTCIQGVCKCREDFVVANDETRCVPVANTYGDDCEQNSQCTRLIMDSGCITGICQCPEGKHFIDNRCYNDKNVGDRCVFKEECVKSSALQNAIDCIGGVCSCTKGQAEGIYECLLDNGGTGAPEKYNFFAVTCAISLVFLHRLFATLPR